FLLHLNWHTQSTSSFSCSCAHPALPSFPTRRSSDLGGPGTRLSSRGAGRRSGTRFAAGLWHETLNSRACCGRESDADVLAGTSPDRKSTRLNSSHVAISYAVFCLKKKIKKSQLPYAP